MCFGFAASACKQMFILTTIESDIRVHPKDLNKPPLVAVTDVIEQQYLDKVIPDLGLPVTIYDVQNIGKSSQVSSNILGHPYSCCCCVSPKHVDTHSVGNVSV